MTNNTRKRALLLYQAGLEVHEILKTLENIGESDDYAAVKALRVNVCKNRRNSKKIGHGQKIDFALTLSVGWAR